MIICDICCSEIGKEGAASLIPPIKFKPPCTFYVAKSFGKDKRFCNNCYSDILDVTEKLKLKPRFYGQEDN